MGANSQLALCILIAASGATSTLISKMSLVLRISEPRGEVGPILVQAASQSLDCLSVTPVGSWPYPGVGVK